MEEQNQIENIEHEDYRLFITPNSYDYLAEISKWLKFLSILGFIFSGFMLLGGLSVMTLDTDIFKGVSSFMPYSLISIYGFAYIVFGAFYLIPSWFLFKTSNAMKTALETNDSLELEASFKNHKSFYKFIGILTLIMLGLYALGIVFAALFFSSL
jgi:hypothetical protein